MTEWMLSLLCCLLAMCLASGVGRAEHGPPSEIVGGASSPACVKLSSTYLYAPFVSGVKGRKGGAVSFTNGCGETMRMTEVVPADKKGLVAQLVTLDSGQARYSHFLYTTDGDDCVFPISDDSGHQKCKNLPVPSQATLSLMLPWAAHFSVSGSLASGKPVTAGGLLINPRSPEQAIDWYLPAATGGDVEAQYKLGLLYARPGARNDNAAAMKWFTTAAEQGHAGAQAALAIAYRDGTAAKQDFAKAFFWFSVLTKAPMDMFDVMRRETGAQLAPAERAAIAKQAAAWKPGSSPDIP